LKSKASIKARSGVTTLLYTALFSLSPAATISLIGDHKIAADPASSPAEAGDLTVAGDFAAGGGIDFGALPTPGLYGVMMTYDKANRAALLDLTEINGSFLWRQNTQSGIPSSKMTLSATNSLSLFKSDGSAAGITLDPNAGAITLGGLNSGIFNNSGNAMVSFSPAGAVTFPTRPLFSGGIDFGSGQILMSSNVSYMRDVMTNLGYRENPVTPTAIKKFSLSGVEVRSVVAVGTHLYVVGSVTGSGRLGTTNLLSAGGNDAFVAKLDANRVPIWSKTIGGATQDHGMSVAVDASGNVFVAGCFDGATSNLGSGNLTSAGGYDGFVVKYNSSGTFQWSKAIGGTSTDIPRSIKVDGNGAVVVAGDFSVTTTNLINNIASAGSNDGFVVKWNSAGLEQWARAIGGSSYDYAQSLCIDSTNAVVVAGRLGGTTTNLAANISVQGGGDGFVTKWDSNGLLQWANRIGGTGFDSVASVAADSSGNIYVAGSFEGSTSSFTTNINSAGATDGLIAKLNSSGVAQWAKPIGGVLDDSAGSVLIHSDGNLYVTGSFSGTTKNLGSEISSAGNADGFLLRLSTLNGSVLNALAVGGSMNESITGAAVLGTDIFAWGYNQVGGSFDLGNSRVEGVGNFLVGLPGFSVVTPVAVAPKSLAWSGSSAVGINSVALGGTAFSEGINSIALGGGISTGAGAFSTGSSIASGTAGIAIGSSKATGDYTVALGSGTASGSGAIVLGKGTASGSDSVAIGTGGVASGANSFAMGYGAKATGRSTFVGGSQGTFPTSASTASGQSSFAWGSKLNSTGSYSQSFGFSNTASGSYSTAFGNTTTAQALGSFVFGSYNLVQGDSLTYVPTDALFVAGNGDSISSRSNAITTLKNGQTTLTNKAWKAAPNVTPSPANSNGNALVVDGHTVLNGKVIISVPQGDISMGIYQ
jgi:hypothetical protein